MPSLEKSLQAWGSDLFGQTLHDEIINLETGTLPLHAGTRQGGMVDDSSLSISLISATQDAHSIRAKTGVFFSEIVGGCNCGDDATATNAYCEMWVIIDRSTAEANISIIQTDND